MLGAAQADPPPLAGDVDRLGPGSLERRARALGHRVVLRQRDHDRAAAPQGVLVHEQLVARQAGHQRLFQGGADRGAAGAEEQGADDAGRDDRPDAGDHQGHGGAQRKADGGAGAGAHHGADGGAGAGTLALVGRHPAGVGARREQRDVVARDPERLELGGAALGVGACRKRSGNGLHGAGLLSG